MQSLTILPSGAKSLIGALDLSHSELTVWLKDRQYPALHGKQIRNWILSRRALSFDQMSDLPVRLRRELEESFEPLSSRVDRHLTSQDDTHKLLLQYKDGSRVEAVLIQESNRRTACISTQVGCGMGCVFCASGIDGLARNLKSGEILEQLIRLRNLTPAGERLTHIVVMGMGEPLANLDNLLPALDAAGDKHGLGIGARHITISTVGLPNRIRQLADCQKQYHLAVSLHAPNNDLRSKIVPTNDRTGLEDILAAADYYFQTTGRQVTYEYVLLGGLNDSPREAEQLVRILKGRKAHVNLIPFNNVEGLPYLRPKDQAIQSFMGIIQNAGISIKIRKRKGSEIDAACGQLRRQSERV